MDRKYDVITLISKYILKKPREVHFANIIKIANKFIKTTFKDSKKVKRIRNYILKCNLYPYFLIYQKLLNSGKKY